MDFNFSEEQDAIRSLADEVFTSKATIERTKEIELSAERVDRELWRELATTGLLGIALPEEFGGGGTRLVRAVRTAGGAGPSRCRRADLGNDPCGIGCQ